MEVLKTISDLQNIKSGCVLTIGNFDGVHIGHQQILSEAKQAATKRAVELVVMTFEPHPLIILQPSKAPGILTPLALKKRLIKEFGVDYLYVVKDTKGLLNLSPRDFVEKFIINNIKPDVVVEGRSFNFGSARTGNIHTLKELGTEMGFEVLIIDAQKIKLSTGSLVIISSTLVRELLVNGKVADAAMALGRPYRLIGFVVPGKGKGRKLGFATANIQPSEQLVPQQGVYAGFIGVADNEEKACASKEKIPAAFSIGGQRGIRANLSFLIEAHLLKKNVGQLYGKWLAMDFMKRIRDQRKFETDADLSAQIAKDCIVAKEILC
jgi:riboflavin kinase/FMN adenylyltransferase